MSQRLFSRALWTQNISRSYFWTSRSNTTSAFKPYYSRDFRGAFFVASAAFLVAGSLKLREVIANDSPDVTNLNEETTNDALLTPPNLSGVVLDDEHLTAFAWGSNKTNLISPDTPKLDAVRSPVNVPWLTDIALKDLGLHGEHGACVDARGDVYIWGDKFHDAESELTNRTVPKLALRGKDITSVQLSDARLFALSSSGKVFQLNLEDFSTQSTTSSPWSPTSWFWDNDRSVPFIELRTEEKLPRNDRFISISAGNDHLLALTASGRTFAHPINRKANAFGQLGFRKLDMSDPSSPGTTKSVELTPKSVVDPYAKASPFNRTPALPDLWSKVTPTNSGSADRPPEWKVSDQTSEFDDSFGFCDRLYEIPSLKGIRVAQAIAGGRSSFVRTVEGGRVLAWGANEYGQLGLGATMTIDTITVPTEVVLNRTSPSATRSRCINISTGGDLTFFMVERKDGTAMTSIDLLSCGMGQWGGLGNGLYSTAQGSPVRVKAVSGLLEYSEETKNLQPIIPHAISVSPTGHVLLTLDTLSRAGGGSGGQGRDLLAWGLNRTYQLGNGKRASLATPANLELPGEGGRLMMVQRTAREVKDLGGKVWRKNVKVEQCAVAGHEASLVYWRIC
ncbi:RCC1/BLIP-II [Rickenella mellea]|uniref:RCC1/BLIP-II n=1 Tax=Rickenella mellea TaxID=50990 RepID=A0A4Y7QIU3_9AGAM|nr:RCC1/BLIP-II [Rickenella mellea]